MERSLGYTVKWKKKGNGRKCVFGVPSFVEVMGEMRNMKIFLSLLIFA